MTKELPIFTNRVCSCENCVGACEYRPCWGTPEDIEKIIDAGYGSRLMNDYWASRGDDINIPAPAIRNYEGRGAPLMPIGRCTFLTKEGLCELHDAGLKPLEGRVTICTGDDAVIKEHQDARVFIVDQWRTPEGKAVYQKWKDGVEEAGTPVEPRTKDLLEMLFDMFNVEKNP